MQLADKSNRNLLRKTGNSGIILDRFGREILTFDHTGAIRPEGVFSQKVFGDSISRSPDKTKGEKKRSEHAVREYFSSRFNAVAASRMNHQTASQVQYRVGNDACHENERCELLSVAPTLCKYYM